MTAPLATLLLTLLPGGPETRSGAALEPCCPGDPGAAVERHLTEAERSAADSAGYAAAVGCLVSHGPGLLAHCHALFAGTSGAVPSERRRHIIADALQGLGRDEVARFVSALASESAPAGGELDAAERRGALALLTPVATRDDLPLALTVCSASPVDVMASELREPLYELARAALAGDPEAHTDVPKLVMQLDPTAASPLVRAVGATGSEEAWDTLAALLGADEQVDRVVLSSIGSLSRRVPGSAPEHLIQRVATYLDDRDPMLVSNALAALRALDAQGHHARLIELLDHEEEALRRDAHATLRAVTGLSLPLDRGRWLQWVESEEDWWRRAAPALFDEIEGGELTESIVALQILAQHRLRRDEIARRILPLLERESPPLGEQACAALGALGAKIAIPALQALAASRDEDDPVYAVAQRALATLGR